MKKTKWLETLKLWLGALLFFAESAVVGCKNLRILPKRAMAFCIAVAMIVAILPVNILLVNAEEPSSALPGARVETNAYGDVFLGGNYIEVGISKHGSFGTSTGPKTGGWHKPSNQSGIGLLSDEDGWNVGEPSATGDFFLPGTKEERWILAYKKDGRTYEHHIADQNDGAMGSWLEEPRGVDASDLANGKLKAKVTGITNQNVKIVITYSFDVNDLFYTTDVEIINVGTSAIENVRFVRSFDPDQDADMHGEFDTYNKVICNPVSDRPGGTDNYALVVARGGETLSGYFFLAFDNRARASWDDPLSPGSAYSSFLWDTASVTEKTFATDEAVAIDKSNLNGYTLEDGLIALTFNIGSLSANGSTTLQYMSSLDPDVQGSLQKVLSGQVDYTEEVLTGFTVGSNYHITCDGVTYVFENVPASTIPLSGTAPTTADSTSAVAYDFLGKTITIVEVDSTGQDASEEQDLTIAPRPGEMKPGETLPDVPAPVIENITTTLNSITIDPAVKIQEYSLDGQNWISPIGGKILFTGLEDGTGYTVYTRVAATSEYPASQICSLLVYTDAYKVTLDYGALGSEVTYAQASGKLDLDIPVFDGYIFMGWYDDAEFTTPHDFTIGVEGDITLYAKFADYKDDLAKLTTAIDAAKAELQTKIDTKADAATVNAAIANLQAAIDALEAVKDDYATADATLKTELEGKIATAKSEAISAAETLVNNAKTELQNAINAKADTATLNEKVDELNDAIATAETVARAYADAQDAALKSELEAAIATAKSEAIASAETLVNNAKTELQNAINAKADTATLNEKVEALNTAITNAETVAKAYADAQDATLMSEFETAIATAKGELEALIGGVQDNLDKAKAELGKTITDLDAAVKAGDKDLSDKITALNTALTNAKAALEKADADNKAELVKKIEGADKALDEAIKAVQKNLDDAKAELTAAINNKADTATLNTKIDELNAAIATAEATAKAYTDGAAAALTTAIATAKSEAISAAETLVNNAKTELQSAIDTKADAATVNAAIANLQNAITALENAKDNYVSADAALKAELEAAIAKAKQEAIDAAKGHIPYIGTNGNWWVGETDTGVDANGIQGEAGKDGKDGITPKLRVNDKNIWEVSYDGGTTWESLGISAVGSNGTNGVTPKLCVNDKNIWEVSYDGGTTWESLGISAVGTNGTNGTNGKDGADGKNGADGKDGADGKNGITPKLRINSETNMWEVSYDGGKTWESLGVSATGATGADGKDGVTPQLRINSDTNMWEVSYDGGATWTSMGVVATGADGKDGSSALPIVISCISLAGMAAMFVMMMSDRKKRAFAGKH